MKTRTHLIGSALLAAALSGTALGAAAPEVYAHYMPWFRAEVQENGSIGWEHWQWYGKGRKHDPDTLLANGRRDIASVFYPKIGPYDGRDPAVLEYHFLTAKAAGIEGFIADWYGPGTYADTVFAEMVKMAERYGMKVGICLEEKAFFPGYAQVETRGQVQNEMERQIRHVLTQYAGSHAYLRVKGRPAFFIFNNFQSGTLGEHILRPDELAPVLDRFKDEPIQLVRGYLNPAFSSIVRAGYLWCGDVRTREEFYQAGDKLKAKGELDYWVGLANPGFNDTGVNGWGNGPRVTDRRGTAEFQDHWNEVMKYRPDAVQIATWNDFEEGSTIEPAEEYGFTFVDETEKNISRLTGRSVSLGDNPWPLRLYRLRQAAKALEEEPRARWNRRLDDFAERFARGDRFLMGVKLWFLELRIPEPPTQKEGAHEKVE